ncbi:Homeobox protein knotted-1-like 2 [Vitis vinifera]|uniref:Homeobox protein knotted-1-like 2 n=1 Tax=Vitis vinifera TaxID=29760 RepID=A0A438F8R9_VITVI|nr:Homeobox protein knotted-1-like 2 [Vitis vinifera]
MTAWKAVASEEDGYPLLPIDMTNEHMMIEDDFNAYPLLPTEITCELIIRGSRQQWWETELPEIDPRAEDRELKNHLLRKYSGYLSSLKQELSKKRRKENYPKTPGRSYSIGGSYTTNGHTPHDTSDDFTGDREGGLG